MKALVTGGAGFIGSHVAELLLEQGHDVVVLDDLSGGRRENLATVAGHPKLTLAIADICDAAAIRPWFDGVDWVLHLAGKADIVPSIEQPEIYFNTNVQGTLNVLQCARAVNAKRFVYAASSSCYGIPNVYPTPETAPVQPQYPYALTKYLGEELVLHWAKVYHLPALSLRLFNVYGPRSRTTGAYGAVFGVFLAQKLRGQPFTVVGDGTQTRDFTFVTDVARAFVLAAQSDAGGMILNVGSGGHYSVNHLVQLLGGPVVHIPKRPGEPDCTFADTRQISAVLGWQPQVSFEQGVATMLRNIGAWSDAPLWTVDRISEATQSWFHYLGERRAC
jgi:UDP-glucose 4-epimerase